MKTALVFKDGNFVGREYHRALVEAGKCPDICISVGRMTFESMKFEYKRTGNLWNPPPIPSLTFWFENWRDYRLWDLIREVDVAIQAGCGFVPKEALAMPKLGWVNVHPGRLPDYKGSSCPEWAILGDTVTIWTTAHMLDEGLDTGPLIWERPYRLKSGWSYEEWRAGIYPHAAGTLLKALEHLKDATPETLNEYVQPQTKGGYVYPRMPDRILEKVKQKVAME